MCWVPLIATCKHEDDLNRGRKTGVVFSFRVTGQISVTCLNSSESLNQTQNFLSGLVNERQMIYHITTQDRDHVNEME